MLPQDIKRIPLPTPYDVGSVNVYVLLGERPTLIDVGAGTEEAERALLRGLADVGVSLGDIEQIVITHTHVDHHGLLERVLHRNPNAKVFAHAHAQIGFRRDVGRRLDFYDGLFAGSGMPSSLRRAARTGLEHMFALEPDVPVDGWLHDGDIIRAGDGAWRVLHTPGHSGDLICLYREATETLITSDHVLPDVSSNAIIEPAVSPGGGRSRSLLLYMDALRKVAPLPVRLALPGHGKPFADIAGLIAERFAMHENRLRDIESRLAGIDARLSGGTDSDDRGVPGPGTAPHGAGTREAPHSTGSGATVFQLASDMFDIRDGDTLTLAMSEVQGHMDVLEARERVVAEERSGLIVYRKA